MKQITILCAICFFTISISNAINNIYNIQQVVNTNIATEGNFSISHYTIHISNNNIWLYLPHKSEKDKLVFLKYNILSGQMDTLNLPFINKFFYTTDRIRNFEVNLKGDFYILFERSFGRFIYDEIESTFTSELYPIVQPYDNIKVVNNDSVLLFRYYNYYRPVPISPTAISIFSFNRKEVVNHITPQNDCIEFSHFSPSNLISFVGGYIAFTQSCTYEIYIYDLDLNLIDKIAYLKDDWHQMDFDKLKSMRIKDYRGNHWIAHLRDINEDISRIDGVFILDSNSMLVRYFPGGDYVSNQIRKIDLWKKENNRWTLKKADNPDKYIWPPTQEYFPLLSFANLIAFSDNYAVSLRNSIPGTYSPEGNFTDEMNISEISHYERTQLNKLHLFIFKLIDN